MSLEATTASVKTRADAADAIGSTVKFVFSGGEGIVYLDGTSGANTISNEDKAADCTVTVAMQDFNDMLSGALPPMNAFMAGKLQIEGDMGVAMKLTSIF